MEPACAHRAKDCHLTPRPTAGCHLSESGASLWACMWQVPAGLECALGVLLLPGSAMVMISLPQLPLVPGLPSRTLVRQASGQPDSQPEQQFSGTLASGFLCTVKKDG